MPESEGLNAVGFQQEFLHRQLWQKQRDICYAYESASSVAIKGCHGSGKTYTVAGIVPRELLTYLFVTVITMAPTLRQVKLMWAEIRQTYEELRSSGVSLPEPATTGWEINDHCKAIGFSTSAAVNAQGFHNRRVLIIADEAIGIKPEIWDAIDGVRMAGDVSIIKLCNPTVPSGPVFDDFGKLRNRPGHKCITISAFDTPNLAGCTMESLLEMSDDELDYAPFPYLTRRRAVVEMYHKWGPTNPRFVARVLGEFPAQATDAVFELAWIEQAGASFEDEELKPLLVPGVYIQVGLDIAGPGADETAVYARIGKYVVARGAWAKADPLDEVLRFLGSLQQRFPGAHIVIAADTVGIGYYFARAIARHGYDVRAFIAGAAPFDPITFKNAKAEHYWTLREWMRNGYVVGVDDEDTKAQLSDVRYRELGTGQIEIEHKAETRARGSSSPDRAEALVMAFAKLILKSERHVVGEYQDLQPI